MERLNKRELLEVVLDEVEKDIRDEEVIHLLLEKKVATDIHEDAKGESSFGQRASDSLAKFVGSWAFVGTFAAILVVWMITNAILLTKPFDPYPFILLNLVLSCVAAIQAPLIMMSQNRQEEKDRMRSENDYKVNLKTEIIIQDLHLKMDQLIANQEMLLKYVNEKEQQ